MRFYALTLGALAAWRITHLLAAEDGPGEILARLRRRAGDGFWGKLLDCFYCLSLWAALPVAGLLALAVPGAIALGGAPGGGGGGPAAVYGGGIGQGGEGGGGRWELVVLLWLALSAGAILIERLTGRRAGGAYAPEAPDTPYASGVPDASGASSSPDSAGEAGPAGTVGGAAAPMAIYHEDP